ncbi:MAG: YicC family protein [Myxococcales bacterium]|nr:YicC family protein [Myxococcales bacterium]MCB9732305.1 YicC family protein [Deltaproteobacteria bacterium]
MSVASMTGYGAGTATRGGYVVRVEVRSVNHKGFSPRVTLPAELATAEPALKALLRDRLVRGAVDAIARVELAAGTAPEVTVDVGAATAVMTALQELAAACGAAPPGLDLVLRHANVLHVQSPSLPPEDAEALVLGAAEDAVAGLIAMREREGEALAADLLARVGTLEALLGEVEVAAPAVLEGMEAALRQRFARAEAKLGLELDPGRVTAELVVMADRADITEEIVRARTHLERFREALAGADTEPCGRRLDFLSQELLRELNTIGSKCRDADIAGRVVDGKVELEKVREQAQNIA